MAFGNAFHAFGIEPPFWDETVRGNARMQWARRNPVAIGNVAADDHAEARDVEVAVFGFERIECPFDEREAAIERVLALEEFEAAANAVIAVAIEYGCEMRMQKRSVAFVDRDLP